MKHAICLKEDALLPEVLQQFMSETITKMKSGKEGENLPGSESLEIKTPGIQGFVSRITLSPDFSLFFTDMFSRDPFFFKVEAELPLTMEFTFNLQGFSQTMIGSGNSRKQKEYPRYQGQCDLTAAKGDMDFSIDIPAGERVRAVEIQCNGENLDAICSATGVTQPFRLMDKVERGNAPVASCVGLIPSSLREALETLLGKSPGGFSTASREDVLFLEETGLDICRDFLFFMSSRLPGSGVLLSAREMEKIREAHALLEERMADPPGLIELARMVGLNDYKLKRGFRQAYGTTVHKALTELRLNRARHLLMEGNQSVSQSALAVGYSNIGDFGQTFKRHFGCLPSQLRSA